MNEKSIGYLLLAALIALPVSVYRINKRQKANAGLRVALVLLSLLLAVIGFVGTFGYAIHAVEDFGNPQVPFITALIGNILLWSISVGAWFFAFRFFVGNWVQRKPSGK